MSMKKIAILLAIIFAFFSTNSCSSDWLDTKPTGSTSSTTIFESIENATLAINGLNRLMMQNKLGNQGYNGEGTIKMYFGNYTGNNMSINLPGWTNTINGDHMDNRTALADNYPWWYYYHVIGNANSILMYIDNVVGPDSEKSFIKAQALTFRAYCFFMLSQLYCNRWVDSNNGSSRGIVLRIDVSDGDQALSTLSEVYAQVYSDLDEAIALFTSALANKKDRDGCNNVNIDVAYATYARAALTRSDYSTALAMASKARAKYPLMSAAEWGDGFCYPNKEWIWSSWGSVTDTPGYYYFHAYIAYPSLSSGVRNTPRCISRKLFVQIPTTDIRRRFFLDPTGYTYTTSTGLAGTQLKALAFQLWPRLDASSVAYAYMQFKFDLIEQPGVGHLNHFRSSEMLLIEAESKYFLNDATGAQNALIELNRSTGRDPEYTCTKTGAELLADIKFYRSLELWGEGFDWFDLKRWKDPIQRHAYADGGNFIEAQAVTINPDAKNGWTWIIPNTETDYNKAITGDGWQ